jgi:hypothetical protein
MGRSRDESSLREESILPHPVHRTNRGGQATYHGPGQLVGYPILDLNPRGRDLHEHLRNLEEVLIRACANFGINAGRREVKEFGNDGWTIVTKDHSLSAQWEHTVLVTPTGYEVMTLSAGSPPLPSFASPLLYPFFPQQGGELLSNLFCPPSALPFPLSASAPD